MFGRRVSLDPSYDDSLSYVASVKEAFQDQPAKYHEFIKLFSDYRAQRVDFASLVAGVEQLFRDYPDLLLGFNNFLPKPNITMPISAERRARAAPGIYKRKHRESEGADFIGKLEKRFRTIDTHVVESFREVMINFKEGKKSKTEVHEEVFDLLYYHEDLIQDFNRFLTNKDILWREENV